MTMSRTPTPRMPTDVTALFIGSHDTYPQTSQQFKEVFPEHLVRQLAQPGIYSPDWVCMSALNRLGYTREMVGSLLGSGMSAPNPYGPGGLRLYPRVMALATLERHEDGRPMPWQSHPHAAHMSAPSMGDPNWLRSAAVFERGWLNRSEIGGGHRLGHDTLYPLFWVEHGELQAGQWRLRGLKRRDGSPIRNREALKATLERGIELVLSGDVELPDHRGNLTLKGHKHRRPTEFEFQRLPLRRTPSEWTALLNGNEAVRQLMAHSPLWPAISADQEDLAWLVDDQVRLNHAMAILKTALCRMYPELLAAKRVNSPEATLPQGRLLTQVQRWEAER